MCSSSSSSYGRSHLAISSVTAWRWPPESLPIGLSSRSSRPRFNQRTRSRNSPRSGLSTPVRVLEAAPSRRQHQVLARSTSKAPCPGMDPGRRVPRSAHAGVPATRDIFLAVDPNPPRIDKERPGDRVQQRRLSRTVRSARYDPRSLIDREVDALEGAQLFAVASNVLDS